MKSPRDLARAWIAKADSDLASARTIASSSGPYDGARFHCQQAVEKLMKGFLASRERTFPFTHDLDRLAGLCEAIEPSLRLTIPEVVALTDYAVKLRYDNDFWPAEQDARAAIAVAGRGQGVYSRRDS